VAKIRKETATHLFFLIGFFGFLTILHRWFSPEYILIWLGGAIGTILPNLDQLIYVYFLKPQDLSSQRVRYAFSKGQFKQGIALLGETIMERDKLIFHSVIFQVIFLVFAFLVVTSSSNLFGKGLVLGFALDLAVDQFLDLINKDNLDSWFSDLPVRLTKDKALAFWLIGFAFLVYLGFVS